MFDKLGNLAFLCSMKEYIVKVENKSARNALSAIRKIKGVKAVHARELSPDDTEFWIRPDSRKPAKRESEEEARRCEVSPTMTLAAGKKWLERKIGRKL